MIRVDILSPVGGLHGGIENVIKCWVKNLNAQEFDLRIIHMTPGTAYLDGYSKAFSFEGSDKRIDMEYYVSKYSAFIGMYGAPDICIATNWPMMPVAASMVREQLGINYKIFSWVHSRIETYQEAGYGGLAHMMYADAHLVLNSHNKQKILNVKPDAEAYVVGNPINIPDVIYDVKEELQLVFVGRLSAEKRLDIVLEAMYRSKSDWKLRVIGTGPMEDEWKKIVEYLKLEDRVEFLGWKENPWEYCKDVVAMVGASEYEGFMLTGLEAMAYGIQVISTPVDGVVDYLKPGVNGYLFEQENAIQLAQILDYIASDQLPVCDPYVCRETAMQYSVQSYISMIEDVLKTSV